MGRFMSRDARQVINQLEEIGGVQCSTKSIYIAEELVFTYYGKTVAGHVKRFYNPDSKQDPNNMEFYVQPTRSINKGKRTKDEWHMSDTDKEIYDKITTGFILEDFSYDQLKILKEICNTYDIKEVSRAIKECQEVKQYSILYLNRVVSAIHAKAEHEREQRAKLRDLCKADIKNDKHTRNPMQMALAQYSWQQMLENNILNRKMEEWIKNEQED